jgi:glyoxylase-like metal-dependent hydrolase (beta-lactamase superfamily II)
MLTQKLGSRLHIVDLKPAGLDDFVASYVLKGEKAVAIVESGPRCSVQNLLHGLREVGVKNEDVEYVFVTHVHIDHAGGAGTLMHSLPNAELVVHPKGAPHMVRPEKLWERSKMVLGEFAVLYGEIEPVPEDRVLAAYEGMRFDLGGSVQLEVLETLGHASHHLAFFEGGSRGVFVGDATGVYIPQLDVTVPATPPPFYLEPTLASLEKIAGLRPRRLYYTHFGCVERADERLKRYEAQLKLWAEVVSDAVRDGDNVENMRKRILERDPQMRVAAGFIGKHVLLRQGVVMQDIQGYVEYFKKLMA